VQYIQVVEPVAPDPLQLTIDDLLV